MKKNLIGCSKIKYSCGTPCVFLICDIFWNKALVKICAFALDWRQGSSPSRLVMCDQRGLCNFQARALSGFSRHTSKCNWRCEQNDCSQFLLHIFLLHRTCYSLKSFRINLLLFYSCRLTCDEHSWQPPSLMAVLNNVVIRGSSDSTIIR